MMWLEDVLEQMNPYLEPKSVLVVDNCTIHHVKGIQEMCDEQYVTAPCPVLFLTTYISQGGQASLPTAILTIFKSN